MRQKYETDLTDEQWDVIAPLFSKIHSTQLLSTRKLSFIVIHKANFCGDGGSYFGWQVLPKRRIVERTFAWLNHSRRLFKDYELTVVSAQILISHIYTLLKRL